MSVYVVFSHPFVFSPFYFLIKVISYRFFSLTKDEYICGFTFFIRRTPLSWMNVSLWMLLIVVILFWPFSCTIEYSDEGWACCVQGLSGQPLSGPDIGGFAGNATPKLFGRWMGVGSMFPFCRGHSEADTNDHEPWSFGEEVCVLDVLN